MITRNWRSNLPSSLMLVEDFSTQSSPNFQIQKLPCLNRLFHLYFPLLKQRFSYSLDLSTFAKSAFGLPLLNLVYGVLHTRTDRRSFFLFLFFGIGEPKLLTFRSSEIFMIDYNDDWIINQIHKKERDWWKLSHRSVRTQIDS